MEHFKKSVSHGEIKSDRSLKSIKVSYKGKIRNLINTLGPKEIALEAEYQSLQDTLEELEESRNRYAALYDFAPVGYVTLDQKGCITEINLTCAALLGLERDQLIGTPMSVLVVKSDMKMFLHHMYRCRHNHNNEKVITELSLTAGNGPPVQVQIMSIPQNGAGDSANCYRTVITDISERKRYEREMARLDRLNLVGEMAATIAHEIRNPMTCILGFTEILKNETPESPNSIYFDYIIEEMHKANAIVEEFLFLARSKPMTLKRQRLNDIIKAISHLIKASAVRENKDVVFELNEVADLLLDEKEIRQLVLNLVKNGLEAMDAGGKITVRTYMNQNDIVLTVSDQGHGIAAEDLGNLGIPFYTTKEKGTGLGLAVCYSIAARHNAKIEIETCPAGTTFSIKFKVLK